MASRMIGGPGSQARPVPDPTVSIPVVRTFHQILFWPLQLYTEIREELKDMGSYLDSDLLRRQSNIFLRLTVITMIGLIGTTTTGFLGMSSLIAATDHHIGMKALYLIVTATAFAVLTLYTLAKSQRIANFLDALTNERLPLQTKVGALFDIWRKKR